MLEAEGPRPPKIDIECPSCKGKAFTATLQGEGRMVSIEYNGETWIVGQNCTLVFSCASEGCRGWMSINTVVPHGARWGRELEAARVPAP